jgi:DnaJ-domain-containing protein 1
MSYKQIFRRANRILKSSVNDFLDQFTKEEQELADFDEQLRQSSKGQSARSGPDPSRAGQQQSTHDRGAHQQQSARDTGGRQRPGEGKRKPGEKDDAYYFAVLGLTPTASVDEIRRTYKRLMRTYHPDAVARLSAREQAAAGEKAKAINEAYQIIERRRGFK